MEWPTRVQLCAPDERSETNQAMKLRSGHELIPLGDSEERKQKKDFEGYSDGLVRLRPGRWLLQRKMDVLADKYYDFKFRESDVVVQTWCKCGTTWTQEIIWTMQNNPNLDNPGAVMPILIRSPFLEFDLFTQDHKSGEVPPADDPFYNNFKKLCPGKDPKDGVFLQMTEASPDPRIIKTHLPLSLLSPEMLDTCKVVYVARNPKDVVTSFHHHSKLLRLHGFVGSLDDFVQYFVDDDLLYGPFWLHIKEAWEKRHHHNLHFIFYEDLKRDPMGEIKRLDAFLNTNLTVSQMKGIIEYTSFEAMRERDAGPVLTKNPSAVVRGDILKEDGGFFRKGTTGSWKDKLTPDQVAKIDQWTKENLDPIGFSFK